MSTNTPKKDRFSQKRGGGRMYEIHCRCGRYLLTYQKDGPGGLLRLYLDRIIAPRDQVALLELAETKQDIPALICLFCNTIIGIPMVYQSENRPAFRLIRGTYTKRAP